MKKKKLEPISLGIGLDGFVPVAEDHWFSDLLKNGKLDENTLCSVITFEDEENEKITP